MRRRNQWSTASYQRPPNVPAVPLPAFSASMASNQMGPPFGSNSSRPPSIPSRHSHARRSMSILDDKENCNPYQFLPPKPKPNSGLKDHTKGKQVLPNNPALGGLQQQPRLSKIKSIEPVMLPRGSPKGYRLSTGASLSPHSKIFSAPRTWFCTLFYPSIYRIKICFVIGIMFSTYFHYLPSTSSWPLSNPRPSFTCQMLYVNFRWQRKL